MFDVTIQCGHLRRGFPFRVTGSVCPAEPENGLMQSYLDDVDILTLNGGSVKWMKLTHDEVQDIEAEVWDLLRNQRDPD
jgi:hypothetical protein